MNLCGLAELSCLFVYNICDLISVLWFSTGGWLSFRLSHLWWKRFFSVHWQRSRAEIQRYMILQWNFLKKHLQVSVPYSKKVKISDWHEWNWSAYCKAYEMYIVYTSKRCEWCAEKGSR